MPTHEALDYFETGTLLITPGTREDLILAAISSHVVGTKGGSGLSGLVLTGGELPNKKVLELLANVNVPVITVQEDTFKAATRINGLMVKIRPGDRRKIRAAEDLVSEYVDIDRLIDKLG